MAVTETFEADGIEIFDNTEANMVFDALSDVIEVEFKDPNSGFAYGYITFDKGALAKLAEAEAKLLKLAGEDS